MLYVHRVPVAIVRLVFWPPSVDSVGGTAPLVVERIDEVMDSTRSTEAGTQPVSRSGQVAETRRRLAEAAHRLFVARGFDAVTIDDIAAEAGTSRRTFFRHFPKKESVVFPDDQTTQRFFREAILRETGGLPAKMSNLKNVLREILPIYLMNAEVMAERRRFIDQSMTLMAHEQMITLGWRDTIAAAISGKLASGGIDQERPASTREARIAAGAISGALVETFWAWYDEGLTSEAAQEMSFVALDRLEFGFGEDLLLRNDPVKRV